MGKFAAIALLFSVQAYACPQLTGAYTCTYQDGSKEVVTIAQNKDANNVDVYNYNGSTILTDNVAYPIPDDQQLKQGTFRAWCADDTTLQTQVVGKYYQQGNYFGDLTMNLNLSLKGTDLHQVTIGSLKNTGGEYPLNGDVTCTHN
jgi:hypothetical protein